MSKQWLFLLLIAFSSLAENQDPDSNNPYAPPTTEVRSIESTPQLPTYKRSFGYGAIFGLVVMWGVIMARENLKNDGFVEFLHLVPPNFWSDADFRLRFAGAHLIVILAGGSAGLFGRYALGPPNYSVDKPSDSSDGPRESSPPAPDGSPNPKDCPSSMETLRNRK
jgi:hypothetical protein